jgi:hypothetical protein
MELRWSISAKLAVEVRDESFAPLLAGVSA